VSPYEHAMHAFHFYNFCEHTISLLYTLFGPVQRVAVDFIANCCIRKYRSSVLLLSCNVTDRRRHRANWQLLSNRHQLAAQQSTIVVCYCCTPKCCIWYKK